MALPVIKSKGIEAYCSDLLVDENNNIYFLSIGGYQTALKGIIANILEYRTVTLIIEDCHHYISRVQSNYSVHYKRLPSGLYQGVLLPKLALTTDATTFLMLSRDKSSERRLFFNKLQERTEIPLHQTWTNWLWSASIKEEWSIALITLKGSYRGFMVDIDEENMKDKLIDEIKNNNPEIMACFTKGDNNAVNQFERLS